MIPIKDVVQLMVCGGGMNENVTKEIMTVANECSEMSDQTTLLCSTLQSQSIQSMIDTTQTISSEMRSMGDDNDENGNPVKKMLDGKLIQKIQQMIDQSKTKQVLLFLDEINQATNGIQEKASVIQQSLQRGINSLPSNLKEEYDKDTIIDDNTLDRAIHQNTNNNRNMLERDTDNISPNVDITSIVGPEENEMLQLLNIDNDVKELETTCQRSSGINGDTDNDDGRKRLIDLDVLKNLFNGSLVYDQVQQKGIKCQSILQQMRTLFTTVTSLMQAFLTGGCCIQTMSILNNIKNLFRCRNIIQILHKAIQTIQHMIQTLVQVIQKTFTHIQKVIKEFIAAKQIGKFVTNAVQKTKVGQVTSHVVTKIVDSKVGAKVGDVCTNIVSNIFK